MGQKLTIFIITLLGLTTAALANPDLNSVESGSVTVQQTDANTLTVNQSSTQAIINWNSFNIAPNETTHFIQPAGGVALNRIDPTQGASQIFGQLTATGRIILINQAGIFFGPGSKVDVVGIVASTSNISNDNFLAGRYVFDQPSSLHGSIVNQGEIIAAEHGLVALMGSSVANDGTIRARLGNVALASGKSFTVDFRGDQMINFVVNDAEDTQGTNPDASAPVGSKLTTGVSNSGAIYADGGVVVLSAKAAEGVLDRVINTSGIIEAKSVGMQNGEIILSGEDTPNGIVEVGGTLDASGLLDGSTGGNVTITGQKILVNNTATIDVSGDAGGGNINIGGGAHGLGDIAHADMTVILPEAQLLANAITTGNGGNIVVWSDSLTRAYGEFSATGGALSGNGGFIETSSHDYLDVSGIQINTAAANGERGVWLLDPNNLTINDTGPDSDVSGSSPFQPSGAGPSVLTTATINAALVSSDVVIETGTGAAGETGTISLEGATISWSSDYSLTFTSADTFAMDFASTITGTGAGNLTIATQNGASFTSTSINLGASSLFTLTNTSGTAAFSAGTAMSLGNFAFTGTGGLTASNTSITTAGSQTYNGPVTMTSNNPIVAGGSITYNGLMTSNLFESPQTITTTGTGTNIAFNSGLSVGVAFGLTGTFTIQGTGSGGNTISFAGDLSLDPLSTIVSNSTATGGNIIDLSGVTTLNGASGELNLTLDDAVSNQITSGTLYAGTTQLFTFSGYQDLRGNSTGGLTLPSNVASSSVSLSTATSGTILSSFSYSGFAYGSIVTSPPIDVVNILTTPEQEEEEEENNLNSGKEVRKGAVTENINEVIDDVEAGDERDPTFGDGGMCGV